MSTLTVLLVLAVVYLAACSVWPYRSCRRCGGSGKSRSPNGKSWRTCGRCGGNGQQLRVGARRPR